MAKQPWTVFGIYTDNMQRHAMLVSEESADKAEVKYRAIMEKAGHDMLVAAVVKGDVDSEDSSTNAGFFEEEVTG